MSLSSWIKSVIKIIKDLLGIGSTTTTTTTTQSTLLCGCSNTKVDYTGVKETIINGLDGKNDVRALINWSRPSGPCTWLTDSQVRPNVHFDGNVMTVICPDLGNNIKAHYLGFCQPSSQSPLVEGNHVTVGSGTLRLVFESRAKQI